MSERRAPEIDPGPHVHRYPDGTCSVCGKPEPSWLREATVQQLVNEHAWSIERAEAKRARSLGRRLRRPGADVQPDGQDQQGQQGRQRRQDTPLAVARDVVPASLAVMAASAERPAPARRWAFLFAVGVLPWIVTPAVIGALAR